MTRLLLNIGQLLLALTLLAGCGGGGGAESTPAPTPVVTNKTVQLTINGTGTVRISDGQTCQQSCTLTVSSTSLELTPQAAEASQFDSWQQDCTGTGSCRLDLTTATSAKVVASFVPRNIDIRLNSQAGGSIDYSSGTIRGSCSDSCTATIPYGATVLLQAKSTTYHDFAGWVNVCSSTANTASCEIVVREPVSLTAKFVNQQVDLRIVVTGQGEVGSAALAAPCRGDCTAKVNAGSEVELNAVADAGQSFSGFSEPCSTATPCKLTMDANKTLSAGFVADQTADSANYIVISNPTEQAITNLPLQFARPFVEGEITQLPQLKLGEQLLTTQADVKQRHADGSVRHAIISVVVPQIPASGSVRLQVVNQAPLSNQSGLTPEQMLADEFDFDAQIKATFAENQIQTRSARDMLSKGKFSYWVQGPVATTVLIADHSVERTADFGSDAHRSVRPMFYATFWPSIKKVQVRFIGEITNTQALQDQSYDLTLSGGWKNPQQLYQQTAVPHQAMTRWTRQFWLGTAVPVVSLNHQLGYLARTKLIPNFDTSRIIPESTIIARYKSWQTTDSSLYGGGHWQKAMATAGGRQEIGMYPAWTVRWLYSGDWRLTEIAMRHAEMSGGWPYHVREGDPERTFDEANTVSGLGRILSINQGGRPTAWLTRIDWHEIVAKDKIIPVATLGSTRWNPDVGHHPDMSSAQYLLTGDYYFLEQSWFSAAFTSMDNNATAKSSTLGRGPTGSEGALYSNESRAQAWAFRTRVHTASVTPDGLPERLYFETLTHKALAIWEGLFNVQNPNQTYPDLWNFARNTIAPKEFPYSKGVPSPLGQWGHGTLRSSTYTDEFYDYSKAAAGSSPWMAHLVILALGRAEELGYPAGPMKAYVGRMLTGPAAEPDFALELLSAYRQPAIRQPDGLWFDSWLQVQDAYLPAFRDETIARYKSPTVIDEEFGYDSVVWGTSSYLHDLPGGEKVWSYYDDKLKSNTGFNSSPKWAIRPRKK
ncbi:InlB B-repeat-containing protein [Rheinheimera texasensis]|uniref:InlB B-repeat-containing protein n=1 Tax=Rheinheimera texasensis TaxID=306205 RepID=UPI0004E15C09|nr:hypothetical protein [Rheinheimera texasensis]